MQVHLSEERQKQLNEYAQRHGQEPSVALDAVLADALSQDRLNFADTLESLREGLADLQAGRTQPAAEVFEELNHTYGLSR